MPLMYNSNEPNTVNEQGNNGGKHEKFVYNPMGYNHYKADTPRTISTTREISLYYSATPIRTKKIQYICPYCKQNSPEHCPIDYSGCKYDVIHSPSELKSGHELRAVKFGRAARVRLFPFERIACVDNPKFIMKTDGLIAIPRGSLHRIRSQLNGIHGEATNSDDVKDGKVLRPKRRPLPKAKQPALENQGKKEYVPRLYLTVSPALSLEQIENLSKFESITMAGELANVTHLKYNDEKDLISDREYLKAIKTNSVRSSHRCFDKVTLHPIVDFFKLNLNVPVPDKKEDDVPVSPANKADSGNSNLKEEAPKLPQIENRGITYNYFSSLESKVDGGLSHVGVFDMFTVDDPNDESGDCDLFEHLGHICDNYQLFDGAGWYVKYLNPEAKINNLMPSYEFLEHQTQSAIRFYKNLDEEKKFLKELLQTGEDYKDLTEEEVEKRVKDRGVELFENWCDTGFERIRRYNKRQGLHMKFELDNDNPFELYKGEEFPFSFSIPTFGKRATLIQTEKPSSKHLVPDELPKLKEFCFKEHFGIGLSTKLYYYDSVTFNEPLDLNHKDERFLSNGHGDIKCEASYCRATITTHYKSFGFMASKKREVLVSLELFKQMLSPANYNVGDSYFTNTERMKRCCRTMAAVNISKDMSLCGENVSNNTFEIACYYLQSVQLANPEITRGLHLNA